ncbi:hypothetical protein BB559_001883 [Furculomyces boomerangus]|uniref:Uncharacterized protein n=1 Tax=Furculomyces boomerangus TaxID=61424 RepID=A0A2T9YZQ0_9FUNG|nr:hypothetical protein BB559_001883 [Furculomyces boomerangus]
MEKAPLPKNLTMNWKYYLKIGLLVILLGLKAVMACFSTKLTSQTMVNSVTVSEIMSMFAILVGTAVHHYESLYHYVGSPLMLLYWNFNIAILGLWYWTQIEIFTFDGPTEIYFILSLIEGVLVFLIWLLELFKGKKFIEYVANVKNKGREPCPEQTANIYSRLTFQWMTGLLSIGKKRVLRIEDMWQLPKYLSLDEANYRFNREWKKEITKYPTNPNLWRVFARSYGGVISVSMIYRLIEDILGYLQTLIFSQLLGFVSSYARRKSIHEPIAKGFILSVAMLLISVSQSIFSHQYFHLSFYTGINVNNVLTAAVYKKSLKLSNSARQNTTTGDIFNRMTVDAQKISLVITYINIIWSGPLQVILAVTLLYNTIGPSAFTGVCIMIVGLPVAILISKKMQKIQKAQMKNKDKRIRLIDEILSKLRNLKQYGYNYASQSFVSSILSFLVSFGTFGVYSFFGKRSHGPLNAQLVFVSLSLFNRLQAPITIFPLSLAFAIEANVSCKRIIKLLISEEIQKDAVITEEFSSEYVPRNTKEKKIDPELMVEIKNGTFTWGYIQREKNEKKQGDISKMTKKEKKEDKKKQDNEAKKNDNQEGDLFDDTPIISDINFKSYYGELVGIVGRVGSGKSSMVSAMLGDMKKLSGTVKVKGRVAYVPQQPWIINSTFRENILFGQPYNEKFYKKVIKACELEKDIEMLKGGDNAEIGEKGINISGGQRACISLARAVYSKADVYLLDDPLSAVDAHVGRNLMKNVIGPTGLLKHKCRILVTHAVHYLPILDNIYVVDNGRVVEHGTQKKLTSNRNGVLFQILGKNANNEFEVSDVGDKFDEYESEEDSLIDNRTITNSSTSTINTALELLNNNTPEIQNRLSVEIFEIQKYKKGYKDSGNESQDSNANEYEEVKKPLLKKDSEEGKLICIEKSQTGRVKLSIFMAYFKATSLSGMLTCIFLLFMSQLLSVMANLWLKNWSSQSVKRKQIHSTTYYILIYGIFGLARAIASSAQNLTIWVVVAIQAAKKTHSALFQNVMHLPMSFFDTTPLGRVLNRFSKDQETIDSSLPKSFDMWAQSIFAVIAALVVISMNFYMFIIAVIPMAISYWFIYEYYITSSRELMRLESTTRSPIYAHFQETLYGVSTIRSYNHTERFINQNSNLIVTNTRAKFPYLSLSRWLGLRLEVIGGFIIFFASLFAVLTVYIDSKKTNGSFISPSTVGMAVSYSLTITHSLNMSIHQTAELENNIVSIERNKEYSELPTEAPEHIPENKPPSDWPEKGEISFRQYSTRYREGLDLVLKNIDLTIPPGSKVGVVGKTGAGKSSLSLALFRIIEAAEGSIVIDGIDISKIGLADLRSNLIIAPQDPILFEETLRYNLDPFEKHSDADIWNALELSKLKPWVLQQSRNNSSPTEKPGEVSAVDVVNDSQIKGFGLDIHINQGGTNLSLGQRQLLCLARALLHRSRILILDEATAAIDVETDRFIQEMIRSEFKHCTVITIAHRLNTIMDSDYILVLDEGRIVEFDTPESLLADPNTVFSGLAARADGNM